MKAADVGDDVFGSCSRLRSREWGGEGRNMTKEYMFKKGQNHVDIVIDCPPT
jgi:hypothetical protein